MNGMQEGGSVELENGSARVVFDLEAGGRLASLCIDGTEVLVTQRAGDTEWGCYVMAPWAGRVREGRFQWHDRQIELPLRLPPHALHGTVLDAPWAQWDQNTISCALGADWPWGGEVRSVLSLHPDRLVWRLEVHAHADAFPAVVGWHPWFRRQLADGSLLMLDFEPSSMLVRDATGIPTGEHAPPSDGPWDDCFIGVDRSPTLRWSNGLEVEVSSTCTHWVVYSEPEHAICVEPQSGPPDAFNLGRPDTAAPGSPLVHTMTLRWRRRSDPQ